MSCYKSKPVSQSDTSECIFFFKLYHVVVSTCFLTGKHYLTLTSLLVRGTFPHRRKKKQVIVRFHVFTRTIEGFTCN